MPDAISTLIPSTGVLVDPSKIPTGSYVIFSCPLGNRLTSTCINGAWLPPLASLSCWNAPTVPLTTVAPAGIPCRSPLTATSPLGSRFVVLSPDNIAGITGNDLSGGGAVPILGLQTTSTALNAMNALATASSATASPAAVAASGYLPAGAIIRYYCLDGTPPILPLGLTATARCVDGQWTTGPPLCREGIAANGPAFQPLVASVPEVSLYLPRDPQMITSRIWIPVAIGGSVAAGVAVVACVVAAATLLQWRRRVLHKRAGRRVDIESDPDEDEAAARHARGDKGERVVVITGQGDARRRADDPSQWKGGKAPPNAWMEDEANRRTDAAVAPPVGGGAVPLGDGATARVVMTGPPDPRAGTSMWDRFKQRRREKKLQRLRAKAQPPPPPPVVIDPSSIPLSVRTPDLRKPPTRRRRGASDGDGDDDSDGDDRDGVYDDDEVVIDTTDATRGRSRARSNGTTAAEPPSRLLRLLQRVRTPPWSPMSPATFTSVRGPGGLEAAVRTSASAPAPPRFADSPPCGACDDAGDMVGLPMWGTPRATLPVVHLGAPTAQQQRQLQRAAAAGAASRPKQRARLRLGATPTGGSVGGGGGGGEGDGGGGTSARAASTQRPYPTDTAYADYPDSETSDMTDYAARPLPRFPDPRRRERPSDSVPHGDPFESYRGRGSGLASAVGRRMRKRWRRDQDERAHWEANKWDAKCPKLTALSRPVAKGAGRAPGEGGEDGDGGREDGDGDEGGGYRSPPADEEWRRHSDPFYGRRYDDVGHVLDAMQSPGSPNISTGAISEALRHPSSPDLTPFPRSPAPQVQEWDSPPLSPNRATYRPHQRHLRGRTRLHGTVYTPPPQGLVVLRPSSRANYRFPRTPEWSPLGDGYAHSESEDDFQDVSLVLEESRDAR